MGCLHTIRIVPNTKKEKDFKNLLDSVGVKPDLVMCKSGLIFNKKYDEYMISDGLYQQICERFESIRGRSD